MWASASYWDQRSPPRKSSSIQLRDRFGNDVVNDAAAVQVTCAANITGPGTVADGSGNITSARYASSGVFKYNISNTVVGINDVSVSLREVPGAGAPASASGLVLTTKLTIVPGEAVAVTTAVHTSDTGGLGPACVIDVECHALVAGATVQMRAVTADEYGNPRDADAGPMLFSTSILNGGGGGGGDGDEGTPALAAGDGTYSFAVTLSTAGSTPAVTFQGGTVGNTPTRLSVSAGESAA